MSENCFRQREIWHRLFSLWKIFDAFTGTRGKFVDIKNQEHENFINQLLVELDGFEKQEGVLLMATVSDKGWGKIDPALLRPGRMDRIFRLGPPKPIEREMILRTLARDNMDPEFVEFVDWKKVHLSYWHCAGSLNKSCLIKVFISFPSFSSLERGSAFSN